MTSAKFSVFWTPHRSPIVTYRHQLILFHLTAFWGPPIPHPVRMSYIQVWPPNPFSTAALIALRSLFEWVRRGPGTAPVAVAHNHPYGRTTDGLTHGGLPFPVNGVRIKRRSKLGSIEALSTRHRAATSSI